MRQTIANDLDDFKKTFKVHRLVALAFIENPENKSDVNHKDKNKLKAAIAKAANASKQFAEKGKYNVDENLIKEESTEKTFVKVGITSKRFIMRRFSKAHGYEGYIVETILRRIETPNAEDLESEIKEKLNKKRSVKKYRPILESFSGYSECFDYLCLNEIVKIFDDLVSRRS